MTKHTLSQRRDKGRDNPQISAKVTDSEEDGKDAQLQYTMMELMKVRRETEPKLYVYERKRRRILDMQSFKLKCTSKQDGATVNHGVN